MITRGYYIGEIIDSLTSVAEQVEMRCALGLTDLNKYVENFTMTVLNLTLDLELANVNVERSNEPGLDLIDQVAGKGFQVTSMKTSQKVNDTLEKVAELENPPKDIYVFVVGKRQTSYTLDENLCKTLGFDESHIWDITRLSKNIVELPIDALQRIHDYIRKEFARVKIELEIPHPDGSFPTSIMDYVEEIPKPVLTDFSILCDYLIEREPDAAAFLNETKTDLREIAARLAQLPRITREFYAFLLERRDEGPADGDGNFAFNYNRLKRICRYPELENEITLLAENNFVTLHEPDEPNVSPYLVLRGQGKSGFALADLISFVEDNGISIRRPIVNLDFSAFGR